MANEIDALLARVDDATLRQDLKTQFNRLRQKRQFGLVFEEHLPERVTLPQHPIRRGTKVVPRDNDGVDPRVVMEVSAKRATLPTEDGQTESVPIDSLVAIAEFGEPIYPGLTRLGSIERGGDKPAHVVIKGENHHALEALRFTHAGKIDCIYIDPPYNTGARDWKYNNDYVDGDDAYRHSKWLAMMQRRLLLAKDLLNPEDSVLIVTIDERELHRLSLLLEQTFPAADKQLATAVINRAGSPKPGRLNRVEEYVLFLFIGDAAASQWENNLLFENDGERMPTVWFSAMRVGGGKALRSYYKETVLFYPVYLNARDGSFHSVGAAPPMHLHPPDVKAPEGTVAMWPVSRGVELTWRFTGEKLVEYLSAGTARLGRVDRKTGFRSITYLRPGTLDAITQGIFKIASRTEEGALVLEPGLAEKTRPASTVWNSISHYARDHGSKLNAALIPGRSFPYPKSLYAVEDSVRIAVGDKPDAVICDFFAGSGTTAHAVARLNRQDGGRRRSVVVTNNEVSEDEAKRLSSDEYLPGDPEWEALGIFENITRPRIEAAITGLTHNREPVKGDYKFTDEFAMAEGFEENVEFLELTYLDAEDIELDMAFAGIAPLLWMRAGSRGPVIEECLDSDGERLPYAIADTYSVLFDPDQWRTFVEELPDEVTTAFVVTDSASIFAGVASELPDGVDVVRLYENYLTTFAINQGGQR